MEPHFTLICDYFAGNGLWRVSFEADSQWVKAEHRDAQTPAQGWKLHVSATVLSAESVLRQALPVLLAEPCRFKAATACTLQTLNDGQGGLSQIGKFLTLYPDDESQAVRLAAAIDAATRGLRGPAVPSDRALSPGSLVSYRFGGFSDLRLRTPLGESLPALRGPDGTITADRRSSAYTPPDGVVDPFLEAGVTALSAAPSPLLAGRYLRTALLHQSPRGAVTLAVDIVAGRPCVIKQAKRDAMVGRDGRDARDRLRDEAVVLAGLAPDQRFPESLGLVSEGEDLYLILEDMEGETLEETIAGRKRQGIFSGTFQIIAWARELAAMLGSIHAHGYVYGDLKSTNVIVAPGGRMKLLDFDSAQALSGPAAAGIRGTRGYMSPQQGGGERPSVADDIHSLGAVLYFIATGAEPSQAPRPNALLDRPVCVLNPALPPDLASIIACCLDPVANQRYADTAALIAALTTVDACPSSGASPSTLLPSVSLSECKVGQQSSRSRARSLAFRLADTLCREAIWVLGRTECCWRSRHPASQGMHSWHINTGSGGTLLALAELVSELDDPTHRETLAAGAANLCRAPFPAPDALTGLYIGEAGTGAALLRAAQVLGENFLLDAALARSKWVGAQPFTSPDLFHGTAGRLRFHLWLWRATGCAEVLGDAVAAGEALLASRCEAGWRIPEGYGKLSGKIPLGYAHGAAGIADALLDLFDVTGDVRCRDAASRSAAWLRSLARPCLTDGSGLAWPSLEGTRLVAPFWCHGAAGIGRFFLHAARSEAFPDGASLAARCARAVAQGIRWASPTACHGLAGGIEFLLDCFQDTRDSIYLTEARILAHLLEAFGTETEAGLAWPSESPGMFTPDYQVGYAGIALCMLRLAAPERLPHQLSGLGMN